MGYSRRILAWRYMGIYHLNLRRWGFKERICKITKRKTTLLGLKGELSA